MNAHPRYLEIHDIVHCLMRQALFFHRNYPQVVKFWDWNFKKYSTKQKLSLRKKHRLKRLLPVRELLARYPVTGLLNASCGNIREFIGFLERFVPPRHLTNKVLINFDVVPTIVEHANVILETAGWTPLSTEEYHHAWLHPNMENFLVVNTLGDANALITCHESKKIREYLRHWGLLWLDGIGNVIPTRKQLESAKFSKTWQHPMNFIFSFNQFKWTRVTWLYLNEDGEPLPTKLKFYKDVLWTAAPSLFHDISLKVVREESHRAEMTTPADNVPFQSVNQEFLVEIRRQLRARAPLATALVQVHDENGNTSYHGQFVTPRTLAKWLDVLIDKKNVKWRLDPLVFPTAKISLDDNRFIKNFYLQTIQR